MEIDLLGQTVAKPCGNLSAQK